MSQMSLFAAGMTDPSFDDLEGLLMGPGSIERRGDVARLAIVVADDWRAAALLRALDGLGAHTEVEQFAAGIELRTDYRTELYGLAQRWHSTAGKHAPSGLRLDGPRLWWWCVAAGSADLSGYRLGLGCTDGDVVWSTVGAALAGAGVPGALVGQKLHSSDGPAYRVVGARRLVRLAELVGPTPAGVPDPVWPRAGGHGALTSVRGVNRTAGDKHPPG